MKVKIEVDLSECYPEDFDYDSDLGASPNSSLSEEVVSVIKYEVKNAISKKIGESVRSIAVKSYEDFGQEKIKSIVDFKMNEFLDSGSVKKSNHSDEMISISEKLRGIFDDSNRWNSPYSAMEKIGKKFGDECKKRYDMAFASNIVSGLEKQGLLKEGVLNSIMSDR